MLILSEEQLNNLNREALVMIAASLQDQMQSLHARLDKANARLADTNRQIELLTEQIRIMNQRQFGRHSESSLMEGQLSLFDSFNEAEATADAQLPDPDITEVVISSYRRKKSVGKREEDLEGLLARVFDHVYPMMSSSDCFPAVIRNFLTKYTKGSISYRKPLLWMNIMFMFMLPKTMTVPL